MTDLPVQDKFISEIDSNQNIIYKICHLYTNSTIDFKDLYQDIVLQFWKSYSHFNGKSKLSTWIYQVSLNTALYKLRQEKSKLHLDSLVKFHYDIPELNDSDQKENIEKYKLIVFTFCTFVMVLWITGPLFSLHNLIFKINPKGNVSAPIGALLVFLFIGLVSSTSTTFIWLKKQ